MSTVLVQALQFVLALSLLVTIHELGHFLAARMFGIRVDKFYLFFNPWFSLYKRKIGDVEFGIGWLPLGGYVSIYDSREKLFDAEARAKDELKKAKSELKKCTLEAEKEACREKIAALEEEIKSLQEQQRTMQPEPDELRAKPAWQRLIVMIAGVFMNVVAAIVIYTGILFTWGESYLENENVVHGYTFSEPAKELGFEDRDRILSIDGEHIGNANDIGMKLLLAEDNRDVTVLRNRDTVTFTIALEQLVAMREADEFVGMYSPIVDPFIVDSCSTEVVAALGYQRDDQIIGVGDEHLYSGALIREKLLENSGKTVDVAVLRYEVDSLNVERANVISIATPVNDEGLIGIMLQPTAPVAITTVDYGFWESFPAGMKRCGQEIKSYWDQLVMMVNPDTKLYKEVGGFLSIGSVFPETWDWLKFWTITALLSVILAVMNLLPIPVLDGGHVLFALWEIITRRKPGERFMEIAQTIGFILLLLLLVYANGNDILNLFK